MTIWVDANGWPVPPTVLLGCFVAEILYIRGWMTLVKEELTEKAASTTVSTIFTGARAGAYRWDSWFWRGISFLIALLFALIGDSTPVDVLSGRFFWVHMIQHLLLMVVLAPLLVAAAPLQPLWLGLPRGVRRGLSAAATPTIRRLFSWAEHWLRQPAVACVLLIGGIWVWHWPTLYDLALTDELIHDWCEHLIFLAVSVLFWTLIIPSPGLRPRVGYVGKMACIGFAIMQNVVLAALIGFALAPLYAPYVHLATPPVALSALQDQQIGAGIMWTFGDLPFGVTLSILVHRWLAAQAGEGEMAIQVSRPTDR
jgi:putative membrane protein